jgi:hypothetical protein
MVRDFFVQQNQDAKAWADCKGLLQSSCPKATMPGVLPQVALHAVELSFDAVEDETLRLCLENLPTSFSLPTPTVTLLRQVARALLMKSKDFQAAMHDLDPTWQPSVVPVDPAVRAAVCGG